MFRRVMVANRGEIARRIIRTLNRLGIESVAIYSEADRGASYLKEATKSVCIGPARAKESYLCEEAILQAALQTDCEALHPGFGFLAENAIFAQRCLNQSLSFIGPTPHLISIMGDKAKARAQMAEMGVPILLGSSGVVADLAQARAWAEKISYPVLLKARSGGGGKGMRLVNSEEELEGAFLEASREAQSAFNDGELYVEGFVANARHIEFQVMADHYGNVVCLGERECSIQRKNQKLIEEAPANGLSDDLRQEIFRTLSLALRKIAYTNAGTCEFLLSPDGRLFFMEMNTRIQVEHPVSELVTGIDIVEWQLKIACSERLPLRQDEIKFNGAAIECRINAEDPAANFKPSPGQISQLSWPSYSHLGPVRIDTHIDDCCKITPFYDSMIGKVICYGDNRAQALELMTQTLSQIKLEGIKTTIPFLKAVLANGSFINGHYDCSFVEKNWQQLFRE